MTGTTHNSRLMLSRSRIGGARRLWAFLLLAAVTTAAADDHWTVIQTSAYPVDGWYTARIDGYSGSGGALTIPAFSAETAPNGKAYKITSLGPLFKSNPWATNVTSVTIPNTVTRIGSAAFKGMPVLTSITIPDSVTSIGSSAFASCPRLASVTIGSGVTNIEQRAFGACSALTSVTIPNSVTSLGKYAFEYCGNMTNAIIGNRITDIDDSVFYYTALRSIAIPDSVTRIGKNAFLGCTALRRLMIGGGVTNIEYGAFYDCSGLTSVTIPDSVASIGELAFNHCTSLQAICFSGNAPSLGTNVFNNSTPTVYYVSGTGWTNPWGGRPTSVCQACDEDLVFTDFTPADQEQSVFWDDPQIGAQFLGRIDPSSVNSETFRLSYSGSTNAIPGSYSVTGKTVRFAPSTPLDSSGQKIFATIKGGADGVKSSTGANLQESYYWSFSTMPEVTVRAVTAQVVDDMDWVAGKPASVRVQALWAQTNYTSVFMIEGKVTVAWNGGNESVRDAFRWTHWDGSGFVHWKHTDLNSTEAHHGNAAVFSSSHGTMPSFMMDTPGTNSIKATVELSDSRGRTKQFICQTCVAVKPLAANATWKICFIPLAVGTFASGAALPSMGTIARDQVDFLQQVYPLPKTAIGTGWQTRLADIYRYSNHLNLLNCLSDGQYLSALAADMNDFREESGMDVVVGVVPNGWLKARTGGAPGLAGANWFNLNGLPVAFIEECVPRHITAHEVGHIYAYKSALHGSGGHSGLEWNSSGFDPTRELWFMLGLSWYQGDFMNAFAGSFYTDKIWANRGTYSLLMNHFVAGGASMAARGIPQPDVKTGGIVHAQEAATSVLAVNGILVQTGASCTSDIVRLYPVDNMAASASSPTGDYYVSALNSVGGVLSSVRINPSFETNTLGTMIAFFKVYFGNPSSIARIVVNKLGASVGSVSRPVVAPTVVVTAPATGSTNTGPITISWTGNSSEGTLTYNIFYRPETNTPWTVLGFGETNQTLTVGVGDVACGSSAQVRVVASDGFNSAEALSGLFQVQQRPFVISCSPSNAAFFTPVETDVEIVFSSPMSPATITTNTVSLKDSSGMKVDGSVHYDPYTQRAWFTPAVPLADLSVYTARVESVVASVQGQTMTNAFVSSFRTRNDTNDSPNAMCANGINTLQEAYIAGLDPNDPQSTFQIAIRGSPVSEKALLWSAATGRVYSVYSTTNLLSGFQCLASNIPWTQGSFAIPNAPPRSFYRMDVRLP